MLGVRQTRKMNALRDGVGQAVTWNPFVVRPMRRLFAGLRFLGAQHMLGVMMRVMAVRRDKVLVAIITVATPMKYATPRCLRV